MRKLKIHLYRILVKIPYIKRKLKIMQINYYTEDWKFLTQTTSVVNWVPRVSEYVILSAKEIKAKYLVKEVVYDHLTIKLLLELMHEV